MANGALQSDLDKLMGYLALFKSAVYVRTAPAKRWMLPEEVDRISEVIAQCATKRKVITILGEPFWTSIFPFAAASI